MLSCAQVRGNRRQRTGASFAVPVIAFFWLVSSPGRRLYPSAPAWLGGGAQVSSSAIGIAAVRLLAGERGCPLLASFCLRGDSIQPSPLSRLAPIGDGGGGGAAVFWVLARSGCLLRDEFVVGQGHSNRWALQRVVAALDASQHHPQTLPAAWPAAVGWFPGTGRVFACPAASPLVLLCAT